MDESPLPQEKNESGVGPTVGIIILVALFIIGGIYFFITQEKKLNEAPLSETTTTT